MTTSAVRNSSSQAIPPRFPAGVTLLELVIAMSLLVLLLGIGAVSYAGGMDERVLRKAAVQVEAMASRGHAMSVLHQKPFWLQIAAGKITLAGADTRRAVETEQEERAWGNFQEEEQSNVAVYDEFASEVEISIRRWGTDEDAWIVPEDDDLLIWQFQSTGLCEPLSIRLSYKENWIILHMHPLTARVEEEESYIK